MSVELPSFNLVTNAFRLFALSGHHAPERQSTWRNSSPMPFGSLLSQDDSQLGAIPFTKTQSPMPFGSLLSQDTVLVVKHNRGPIRHQCLSALCSLRTDQRRTKTHRHPARSPMPFGSLLSQDGRYLARARFADCGVTNAFRLFALSGRLPGKPGIG